MESQIKKLFQENLRSAKEPILFSSDESDANRDIQIWNSFREGNRMALDYIFKRHASNLFAYGSRFTKDRDLVLDVIQDLFVELWNRRQSLSESNSIKFYLLKALRRRITRSILGIKRFEAVAEDLKVLEEKVDFSAEYFLVMKEGEQIQKEQLNRAIEGLTRRQRESIYLKFFQGLDNKSIASMMGLTETSVATLVSQAIRALRAVL